MAVAKIPEGYSSVTPYLAIAGAAKAIAFYVQVFGARERMRMAAPDGRIGHAEIEIGGSVVMLADPWPEGQFLAPQPGAASSVHLHLYVDDVDRVFAAALAAGATELHPVQDKFYGDRNGTLRDPFGHCWSVATHVEDVPEAEIRRRAAAMMQQQQSG